MQLNKKLKFDFLQNKQTLNGFLKVKQIFNSISWIWIYNVFEKESVCLQ